MRVVGRTVASFPAGSTRERGPSQVPRAIATSVCVWRGRPFARPEQAPFVFAYEPLHPPALAIGEKPGSERRETPAFRLKLPRKVLGVAQPCAFHRLSPETSLASADATSASGHPKRTGATPSHLTLLAATATPTSPAAPIFREVEPMCVRSHLGLLVDDDRASFELYAPKSVLRCAVRCSRAMEKSGDLDCKSSAAQIPAPSVGCGMILCSCPRVT